MNTTKAYAVKDYAMATLWCTLPFLTGFDPKGAKAWVPMALGGGAIVYSLITQYELSAFKLLSFPLHLLLDAAGGLLLALSPWIFGFADTVHLPHLILGAMEIGIVLYTLFKPEVRRDIPFLKRQVMMNPALRN